MTTTPTPRESAAAKRLAESLIEFVVAVDEGMAERRGARPPDRITVRLDQPAQAAPEQKREAVAPKTEDPPAINGLLTVQDAAKYMSVSDRSVWKLVAARELPIVKVGRCTRIRSTDVSAYVDRQVEE